MDNETHEQRIGKEEEQILLLLAEIKEATAQQVAHQLDLNPTKTEYWLIELCGHNMIYSVSGWNPQTVYCLNQDGHEYLAKNDLLQ